VTTDHIWLSQIPNWSCCYYGQDPIPVPRASLWAAMHTVPAFHVVGSLALAICTISTNDRADFWVFLQFKAAQLLRLAENNGSKTLGNTWCVFCPIVKPHSSCSRTPMCGFLCLDFCNFWRGLKILMPRLVTASGVVRTVCSLRPLVLRPLLRPLLRLSPPLPPRPPTANQKIREAGRFSLLTFDRIWKEKYNPK